MTTHHPHHSSEPLDPSDPLDAMAQMVTSTKVSLDDSDRKFFIKWGLVVIGALSMPLMGTALGIWREQAVIRVELESLRGEIRAVGKDMDSVGRRTERIEDRLDANETRRLGKSN